MLIIKNGYNQKCFLGLLTSSAHQVLQSMPVSYVNTLTLEYTTRKHKVTSELYPVIIQQYVCIIPDLPLRLDSKATSIAVIYLRVVISNVYELLCLGNNS